MPVFQKRKRKNDETYSLWGTLFSAIVIAMVAAAFGLFFVEQDSPTPLSSASANLDQTNRIGLFVGHHSYETDHGAICADGLTERDINAQIADQLYADLTAQGYTVDMFYDFSNELNGYRADLLLALHVYGCMDNLEGGYRHVNLNDSSALNTCLNEYEEATSLERRYDAEYTNRYYRFQQTAETTPVLTIEMGMLEADRYLLTQQQDIVVTGLANTINCFSPLQAEKTIEAQG